MKWKQWIGACAIGLMTVTVQAADWHVEGVGTFPLPEKTTVYTASQGAVGSELLRLMKEKGTDVTALNLLKEPLRAAGIEQIPDAESMKRMIEKMDIYEMRSEDRKGIHVALVIKQIQDKRDVERFGNQEVKRLLEDGFGSEVTPDLKLFLAGYSNLMKKQFALAEKLTNEQMQAYIQTQPQLVEEFKAHPERLSMRMEIRHIDPLTRHVWKRNGEMTVFYEMGVRFNIHQANIQRPMYMRSLLFTRGEEVISMSWLTWDHEYEYFKPMWDHMVYRMRGEA